jgi:hypothetical protein
MNLLKGNGGANNNHKADFKPGSDARTPRGTMPGPNTKNTQCKSGPLKATQSGKR